MKIWLTIIFLISSSVVLAESQAESGNFTITAFSDNYLDSNNSTTNYGTTGRLSIGSGLFDLFLRIITDPTGIEDSLTGRDVDSATLRLIIESVSGSMTSADSIYVYALILGFAETTSDWENRLTDEPWGTSGARGSGTDHHALLISATSMNGASATDTIYFDVELAYDSMWVTSGFVMGFNNNNVQVVKFYSADTSLKQPELYVGWVESSQVKPVTCTDAASGSGSIGGFSNFTAPSFDSYLDSQKVKLDDNNSAGDTSIHAVYRAYGDSTLVEQSDTALLAANDACTYYMLQFDGTTTIKADSPYFWGTWMIQDPNSWDFCVIGGAGGAGALLSTGSPGIPANVQGTGVAGYTLTPCFTAYLTEIIAVENMRRRRIMIGDCLEGEIIIEDKTLYKKIDEGTYLEIADPVFGGIEKCGR